MLSHHLKLKTGFLSSRAVEMFCRAGFETDDEADLLLQRWMPEAQEVGVFAACNTKKTDVGQLDQDQDQGRALLR